MARPRGSAPSPAEPVPPASRAPHEPRPRAGATENGLPELEESLPITLLRAREAVVGLFRPVLQPFDVTEQQWRILRALARSDRPLTVGQLASVTALLGPSIARILPALEERGYIARGSHPTDARRVDCTITDAGRELVDRAAPGLVAEYARIRHHLGADDLRTLDALLARLAAIDGTAPPG